MPSSKIRREPASLVAARFSRTIAVDDATLTEVVGRYLYVDAIAR